MEFKARAFNPAKTKTDCLIMAVPGALEKSKPCQDIEDATGELIRNARKEGELDKFLATLKVFAPQGLSAKRLVLISTGSDEELSPRQFSKLAAKVAGFAKGNGIKSAAVCLDGVEVSGRDDAWCAARLAQAIAESTYVFDQCKSTKANRAKLAKVDFKTSAGTAERLTASLQQGQAIASGVSLTKELGDLPANICTPTYLANTAKKLARGNSKMSVKVLTEAQMKELKMGSLLSVTAGTETPAKMIVVEYKGGKTADKPYVLVGKGVTFDSGGISLKPGGGMDEMKYDMCGAASVLGTLNAVRDLQLPINLVGIIPAVENMPSGKATKPGDIVTSMSGQTIEVLNTDAEGRLILCDALTYAERYKPTAVVDIATLTGACIVALGSHNSGLFSNDDYLANALFAAGETSGDTAWRLPIGDDYDRQLKSNFADMANIGGKGAGSITAACFLARFTKKYPWAHLDIAGTAWNSGGNKGATGRPVGLLVEYLKSRVS